MKPLQGPTRSGNSEKHTSLLGSDAEERVEEDFDLPARSRFGEGRAAASNRSIADIPNPYSSLFLILTKAIITFMMPHSKASRTRPSASGTFLKVLFRKLGAGQAGPIRERFGRIFQQYRHGQNGGELNLMGGGANSFIILL